MAGGDCNDAAIDFSTGWDDDPAAFDHVPGDDRAEGLASFDLRGGKAVEQTHEDVGAFL